MKEVYYSKHDDCVALAQQLNKSLNEKIMFESCSEVIEGKYKCCPFNTYDTIEEYAKDMVPFYFKYSKGEFLKLGVENNAYKKLSTGHKLAALSDIYEVLCKVFGEPTLFYTTKDDEEELNLYWVFKNKEDEIKNFQNNTVFDDANIKDLIIIGESHAYTF